MRPPVPALVSLVAHGLVVGALLLTAAAPAPRAPAAPKVLLRAALLPGPRHPAPPEPQAAAKPAPKLRADKRPVARRVAEKAPSPAPAAVAPRQQVLTSAGAPTTAHELAQAAPPAAPPRTAPAGQTVARRPGPRQSGAGAGNYFGRVIARLENVKRYPDAERRRGREGTVLVRFVLAKSGGVLDCRIEKGSGTEALDAEVLRMVRTAAPFPPLPENLGRESLVLLVPVSFHLRQQG